MNRAFYAISINGKFVGEIEACNEEMAVRRWVRYHGRGYVASTPIDFEVTATLVK